MSTTKPTAKPAAPQAPPETLGPADLRRELEAIIKTCHILAEEWKEPKASQVLRGIGDLLGDLSRRLPVTFQRPPAAA